MDFPKTSVGGIEVPRLICGSNGFLGYSHFSRARDVWLREYFTVERIAQVIEKFVQLGINAVMGPTEEKLHAAIQQAKNETGKDIVYICTPGGPTAEEVMPGIEWCAQHDVQICMPHVSYTDTNLVPAERRIIGLERLIARIRALGMVPGLSTHRPETIVVADAAGYDLETYILPYNSIGFLCPLETDWVAKIINETRKPVMCVKPLAAGRILPPTGLGFVLSSSKPIDMVVIGTISTYEAEEDVKIARQILTASEEKIPLAYSRSKETVIR